MEMIMVQEMDLNGINVEVNSLIKLGYDTEIEGELEMFGWFFVEAIEVPSEIGHRNPVIAQEDEEEMVLFHGK